MKISKMAKTYSSHTPASFQEVFPQFKWEFPPFTTRGMEVLRFIRIRLKTRQQCSPLAIRVTLKTLNDFLWLMLPPKDLAS